MAATVEQKQSPNWSKKGIANEFIFSYSDSLLRNKTFIYFYNSKKEIPASYLQSKFSQLHRYQVIAMTI